MQRGRPAHTRTYRTTACGGLHGEPARAHRHTRETAARLTRRRATTSTTNYEASAPTSTQTPDRRHEPHADSRDDRCRRGSRESDREDSLASPASLHMPHTHREREIGCRGHLPIAPRLPFIAPRLPFFAPLVLYRAASLRQRVGAAKNVK